MAEQPAAKHGAKQSSASTVKDLFDPAPKRIKSTHTAELVIALCGPIGSPLHRVSKILKDTLEEQFEYECKIKKLSEKIESQKGESTETTRFNRVKDLITKGNELRSDYGSSVLADLIIGDIAIKRERKTLLKKSKDETTSKKQYEPTRVCHIIDSIKNQEELNAFRLVYRDMFYFLGVFSPLYIRERNLLDEGMKQDEVYQLINQDSGEEIEHGQTVRDTFPHADFFLRTGSESDKQLKYKIQRFLDLIFQTEIITPSAGETAMYQAMTASGNSACLSRQVGAAIIDTNGELLSVGWNDVPKRGGDLYRYSPEDDRVGEHDKRCMNIADGTCFNDREKKLFAKIVADDLKTANLIESDKVDQAIKVIINSRVKSLLEFSRSIHAEMHAIIIGGQLAGSRIRDSKLYCTTYPCHSCARHIVAAGISCVYYIEPYRKSLATKLHSDTITEDEADEKKVRILPFDGVAPSRYLELFSMHPDSRKENGKMIKKNRKTAFPKCEVSLESIPALEGLIVASLAKRDLISLTE